MILYVNSMYPRIAFFSIFFSMICLFSLKGQALYFHHLTVDDGLPHNTITSFVEDKYGFIWIATLEGLCRFDGNEIVIYYSENTQESPVNNRPLVLYRDNNDEVWISFSNVNQVCKYNYDTDNFTRYHLEELDASLQNALNRTVGNIRNYHATGRNNTWKVSNNRLIQTNNSSGKEYRYHGNAVEEGGLSDSHILCIYLDSNDILWVGTDNGGVHFTDVNKKSFTHYFFEFEGLDFTIDNSLRAICEDTEGFLWIGTRNNGIIRMHPDRATYERLQYVSGNDADKGGKQVRKIYQDNRGDLWIGTRHGLYHYEYKTQKIEHFTSESDTFSIPDNWVYAINEDDNNMLWVGTWSGMASYNTATKKFTAYDLEEITAVRSIAKGKNGGLWIGTENGLVSLEYTVSGNLVSDLKASHYNHQEKSENTLKSDLIYSMDVDDDGNVWMGTGKGLNLYDIHQKRFIDFPEIEFLSDAIIRGVICHHDFVWVSHRNGLTRLNRNTHLFRHFDKSDGLQNNEFSEDAYSKNSQTGELFFGGNNGLNSFFPDSIKDNVYVPQLAFTGLKIRNTPVGISQEVNGKILLKDPIYRTQHLVLGYRDKEFELKFSALHFSNPSKNRYAYQLEGFDDKWIYTHSSRRSAIYSGLSAGKYALKVKASNSDGVWNDDPIVMHITVLPPWWASTMAYVAYLLLFILICVLIVKNIIVRKNLEHRIQLEQLRVENMEEISRIRSTFFTGISHELRTPVTLLIDPLRKLINKNEEDDETRKIYKLMYRNAIRLHTLITQLLDFRNIHTMIHT